jgi:hypothetical protein
MQPSRSATPDRVYARRKRKVGLRESSSGSGREEATVAMVEELEEGTVLLGISAAVSARTHRTGEMCTVPGFITWTS